MGNDNVYGSRVIVDVFGNLLQTLPCVYLLILHHPLAGITCRFVVKKNFRNKRFKYVRIYVLLSFSNEYKNALELRTLKIVIRLRLLWGFVGRSSCPTIAQILAGFRRLKSNQFNYQLYIRSQQYIKQYIQ